MGEFISCSYCYFHPEDYGVPYATSLGFGGAAAIEAGIRDDDPIFSNVHRATLVMDDSDTCLAEGTNKWTITVEDGTQVYGMGRKSWFVSLLVLASLSARRRKSKVGAPIRRNWGRDSDLCREI